MKSLEWRCKTPQQAWAGIHFHKNSAALSQNSIIALHGWLDNAASFIPLANELNIKSILALDLPGHGKSSWRQNQLSYAYTDWIALLYNLFESQKWKNKTLIGHSLGASIAAVFANLFPEKVEKLVLIDAFGPVLENKNEMKSRFQKFCKEIEKIENKKVAFDNFKKLVQLRANSKFSEISTESATLLMKRGSRKTKTGYILRSDPRLKLPSPFRLNTTQSHNLLVGLSCPTLVLRNQSSIQHPYWKSYKKTLQTCPHLKIVNLKGGHHLHMDNAKKTAQEVKTFLGRSIQ